MESIILVLLVILGASLGSFFNVCIYRIPQKKSLVFPASHCPACSYPIPFWLNVPVLGYFISACKCRKCGSKINWHYPLVEFITPILFILLYLKFGLTFTFFRFSVFFALGIVIFFIDAFHQIIPDILSLPLIPLGVIFSFHPSSQVRTFGSVSAAIIGFAFFFLLSWTYWKLKGKMGLGGGDIKLIAGVGAFLGLAGLIFVIIVSSLVGLITIFAIRYDLKKQFSFGPFIVFSSFLYVLWGHYLIDWYLNLFIMFPV